MVQSLSYWAFLCELNCCVEERHCWNQIIKEASWCDECRYMVDVVDDHMMMMTTTILILVYTHAKDHSVTFYHWNYWIRSSTKRANLWIYIRYIYGVVLGKCVSLFALKWLLQQGLSVLVVTVNTNLHVLLQCASGRGLWPVAEAVGCTVSGELRVTSCYRRDDWQLLPCQSCWQWLPQRVLSLWYHRQNSTASGNERFVIACWIPVMLILLLIFYKTQLMPRQRCRRYAALLLTWCHCA